MKKGILFVLAAAFLASCQQEEENGVVSSVDRVTITPIITRATEVNFENQDQIGLSITKEDGTEYAKNELMTFNDGAFAGSLKWYPEGTDKSSFVAYYPYTSAGVPTSFTVHADQSAKYGISDFMAASKSEVLPSANSISMVFKHMLTKMVINVTNETHLDISSVVLRGAVPTANIDLATMKVTASESAAAVNITTQQVTKNTTYRAIVVPQTVAFTLAVTTSDNKTLTQRLASTTLVQGGQYSVNVRVLSDGIIVTLSGEIENWTEEGEIGADNTVPFEEHLDENYFLYDEVKYNTVTLANGTIWMAEPLCYLPKGYTPSSDPTADSHIWYPYEIVDGATTALTDNASVKELGYLYDMEAALGKTITESNYNTFEGAQGICPKGWHIPTRIEYFNLVGKTTADADGKTPDNSQDALFYDSGYDGAKIQSLIDAGLNYKFSGTRMMANFTATPSYQKTVISSATSTKTEWYNKPALNHYMTSTAYKPVYNASNVLTNIQFFGLMSTFTSARYPEGRLSLSYISMKSGQQLRCVRDKATE